MVDANSVDGLISYCRRGAHALADHLGSEALYWPMGDDQFSIGGWLEANLRLDGMTLNPAQQTELSAARTEYSAFRAKAKPPYDEKARREFKSRIDSLNWFLEDVRDGAGYTSQASNRLKLELLQRDVEQAHDQRLRLEGADMRLRRVFAEGNLVLGPELAKSAPRENYWFLYGAPRRARSN